MSLQNIDIESAIRRVADRRIEEAMREGKFHNLPGARKPLDLEPMPANENARLTWWALKLFRQNGVIPDEVQWRKQIDQLREELDNAPDAAGVKLIVRAINATVCRLNTLGVNAIDLPLACVNEEHALRALDERIWRRET